jgi:flavin-dependent dehydrogenase
MRPTLEVAGTNLEYDLVVLATGANRKHVPISGLKYIPPKTQKMTQNELYAGTAHVKARLGNKAHVFLIPHSELIFGTLVPKGPFISVSILSNYKHPVLLNDFLNHETIRDILPQHYELACGCKPQIVTGSGHNYYTNGFVAVGDAVATRLYKDGIGSSLLTSRQAAYTALQYGISRQQFKRYYQPFCNSINSDNMWGKALFFVNHYVNETPLFLSTQRRLIKRERHNVATGQPATKAAWGMFTGSYSYKEISSLVWLGWFSSLGLASLLKSVFVTFRETLTRLLKKRK